MAQEHGKGGKEEADVIDAEDIEAEVFAQDQLVRLIEEKAADGAEENPFSKADEF